MSGSSGLGGKKILIANANGEPMHNPSKSCRFLVDFWELAIHNHASDTNRTLAENDGRIDLLWVQLDFFLVFEAGWGVLEKVERLGNSFKCTATKGV